MYQSRGQSVPSIAQEMDAPSPLDTSSILRYAVSQPLHFAPGTKTVYSNLGYLFLGRVVEETSGMKYEDYVKKHVLNPCGMWHTRVGVPVSARAAHNLEDDVPLDQVPLTERKDSDLHPSLFELIDARTVDSTLGWFSTVYDMARFARCVFDSDAVLNDASLEMLLGRQNSTSILNEEEAWFCSGFRTNAQGALWQDGDPHADDAILYHSLKPGEDSSLPDTWVVFLQGHRLHYLRHKTRDLMQELQSLLASKPAKNHFVTDLTDIEATNVADEVAVKFSVDEHHLDAYVMAVKLESHDIRWVSPYTNQGHTSFLIISRLLAPPTRSTDADFRLEHGLSEEDLLSKKLHMERQGYNITFLQSYRSQSHQGTQFFLAIFRRDAFSTDTQLKYGTDHLPEPYDKLVEMYHEKHFYPLVQSVMPHGDDQEEHMSFIFIQRHGSKPVDFKNYYRLPDSKLEKTIVQNARVGRILSFLHAYQIHGKSRFSAVFTNETRPRWQFQGGLDKSQAITLIESRLGTGLWPAFIVGYVEKGHEVKYAVFMKSDDSHVPASLNEDIHLSDSSPELDKGETDSASESEEVVT